MDKEKLLENELLVHYILGELSDEDVQQVESQLSSDRSLKVFFDDLELSFEQLGQDNSIVPPADVKRALLKRVETHHKENADRGQRGFKTYFAAAASLAVLFMLGSFWMYSKLNTLQDQIKVAEQNNNTLNLQIDALQDTLEDTTVLFAAITDPDTKQYILEGNALMPEGKVVSYVNHNDRSVIINSERLPKLDVKHDYQMWADVDGEMINMGVIEKGKSLLAMHYIDRAESLNITIEPAGGSDHPTVERLVTNVYLN